MEALTGRRPDVSAIKGYVGQAGWARKWDGKANAQRDNATPVIYMFPSPSGVGHLVFNLETRTEQLVYSLAVTTDPGACSLMLAESDLMRPRGAYGTPKEDEYTACLRAMILPRSHDEDTMVRHDLITGMPESLYAVRPCLGADGDLVMCPTGEAVPMDDPSEDARADQPHPVARGAAAPGAPDGAPLGAIRWVDDTSCLGADVIKDLPPTTRLWYRPNQKSGASAARYAIYSKASTIQEALALNKGKFARPDLNNDLRAGLCWLMPPASMAYATWLARTPMGRAYAAQHGPVPAMEDPGRARAYVALASTVPQFTIEPWYRQELTAGHAACMLADDPVVVETRRLLALEEGPPVRVAPRTEAEAQDDAFFAEYDHGTAGDQRRHTQRYLEGALAARSALLEDDPGRGYRRWASKDEWVPAFCGAFDIAPVTVMFGGSDVDLVPPKSVSAARRLADYAAPFGWKEAITKEVRRVEGFKAWAIVPMTQYWAELRMHPGRVSIGYHRHGPHQENGPGWQCA